MRNKKRIVFVMFSVLRFHLDRYLAIAVKLVVSVNVSFCAKIPFVIFFFPFKSLCVVKRKGNENRFVEVRNYIRELYQREVSINILQTGNSNRIPPNIYWRIAAVSTLQLPKRP